MSESSASSTIDEICDAFERAWQGGNAPAIEAVLQDHPAVNRRRLLEELIAIEAFRRAKCGQSIQLDNYRSRFPEVVDRLPDLLRDALQVGPAEPVSDATAPTYVALEGERTVAKASAISGANPSAPTAGQQLGPYRLVKQLGAGGMGTVWEAVHLRLEKTVALKLLAPQLMADPGLVSRFDREMKAVGKLEHQHLVRAYDAGEDRGVHYLAMEYIDGMDLARYVRERGPLSIKQTLHVLIQSTEGLAEAHRANLIHRDIKPANLMLTRKGVVKVTDLGLARLQGAGITANEGTLTAAGQILGTPDFMAPEQWDDTHTVDGRCDLYALGCTLFFLLTGCVPYRNHSSLMHKMRAHLTQPMPDLLIERQAALSRNSQTSPISETDVPESLVIIYRKLVEKDPEQRFRNADELLEALRAVSPSAATSSTMSTPAVTKPPFTVLTDVDLRAPSQVRRSKSTTPWTGALITLAAILTVAFGIAVVAALQKPETSPKAVAKNSTQDTIPAPTVVSWQGWPIDAPKPAIAPFDAAQAQKHQEEWAAYLKVPVEYTNSIGMKFRLIPPGEFLQGSTEAEVAVALELKLPEKEKEELLSETPQHRVIITKPYYLGMYEVTAEQYLQVMKRPPQIYPDQTWRDVAWLREFDRKDFPLIDATWVEAAEFCSQLCEREHLPRTYANRKLVRNSGYRLPTEAQWEQACRAGTQTPYWCGDGGQVWKSGWCYSNSEQRIHVVGELNANPYRLYDILGNLSEWCEDRWSPASYASYKNTPAVDPEGPAKDTIEFARVLRDGSWSYGDLSARSAARHPISEQYCDKEIGFRVALTVDAVQLLLTRSKTSDIPQNASWHGWPADAPKPAIAPFDAAQAQKHQDEWAAYLKIPVEYTNSIGMKFRLIPPGEFLMGRTQADIEATVQQISDASSSDAAVNQSRSRRLILTKPFYQGIFEVTQEQYEAVMGPHASHFSARGEGRVAIADQNTTQYPVEMVTWLDAADFCTRLNQKESLKPTYFRTGEAIVPQEGSGYRLPTDAEWEYTCRSGTTHRYWSGDRWNDLQSVAWTNENSSQRTHPVGERIANPWGLFDVHGNVWEWIEDAVEENRNSVSNPSSMNSRSLGSASSDRFLRGGCWLDGESASRFFESGYHRPWKATDRHEFFGFRVTLPVEAVRDAMHSQSVNSSQKADWHGWPADAPKPAIAPFNAAQAKKYQEEWAEYLKVPVEYTNSSGMKFRLIPPGEFLMGCTAAELAAVEGVGNPSNIDLTNATPQHRTILTKPYYMAVHEVTAHRLGVVMKHPQVPTDDKLPAVDVTWHKAVEFCGRLAAQARKAAEKDAKPLNVRLPTEAEWEFACRAGTQTKFWTGDDIESVLSAGWFEENAEGKVHPVGELAANPFGLHDVHGNVWEWCSDGYRADFYQPFKNTVAIDPIGDEQSPLRVFRGGRWLVTAIDGRSAYRYPIEPELPGGRFRDIGFRIVMSVDSVRD